MIHVASTFTISSMSEFVSLTTFMFTTERLEWSEIERWVKGILEDFCRGSVGSDQ